jgi:hypothetical protein
MRFTTLRRWVHELFKFRFDWVKHRPVRTRSRRPMLQAEPLTGREPVGALLESMLAGAALPLLFDGGEEWHAPAWVADVLDTRSLRLLDLAAVENVAERSGGERRGCWSVLGWGGLPTGGWEGSEGSLDSDMGPPMLWSIPLSGGGFSCPHFREKSDIYYREWYT